MTFTEEMFSAWNLLSVLLLLIIGGSAVQGALRGASGSARQLLVLVTDGAGAILSLLLAWKMMNLLSPALRDWLIRLDIRIPDRELGTVSQIYYTLVTGFRDFSLMRSGAVLLVSYILIRQLLSALLLPWMYRWYQGRREGGSVAGGARGGRSSWISTPTGAFIGSLTGTGRALMLVAVLFVYTSLFPGTPFTGYVQQSSLYQKGAKEVIEPFTGDVLDQLPVFTKAVEEEFGNILRRKYEVLDARIPEDIASAAKEITAKKTTEEEKARALYQWVGTRVAYDWEKVRLYEEKRIWKEQTPEDTFRTREGVCIDYSRLYAVMARSVGLDVKVVTGLGYDGRGGYGPHAWNEVYLSAEDKWVPLDSTWVSSGGNWFNPTNFYDTHIKEA